MSLRPAIWLPACPNCRHPMSLIVLRDDGNAGSTNIEATLWCSCPKCRCGCSWKDFDKLLDAFAIVQETARQRATALKALNDYQIDMATFKQRRDELALAAAEAREMVRRAMIHTA